MRESMECPFRNSHGNGLLYCVHRPKSTELEARCGEIGRAVNSKRRRPAVSALIRLNATLSPSGDRKDFVARMGVQANPRRG